MFAFRKEIIVVFLFLIFRCASSGGTSANCRDRNNNLRQDGGFCFEIPPWQHLPVELSKHVASLRNRWTINVTQTRRQRTAPVLVNSEITRYMDTVIAPFLDTYHRNIQNAYQQLTSKLLKRIKEEINAAVKKKNSIYTEMNALASNLNIPSMCDEERRTARTIASNHVAIIYACTEEAKASIAKMGKYAEEMISITRKYMQGTLGNAGNGVESMKGTILKKNEIEPCLRNLSRSAIELGYELDLSLTNARRHNEQSCEKLSSCATKGRKKTEETVQELKDLMYQCVYA